VPAEWVRRAMPGRRALAVPIATIIGAAMPGCECGTVPVAAGLMRRGVPPGPATALMLSAPATNPVVLAATAAAFPGQPGLVAARFVASLSVALAAGFCGLRPRRLAPHEHVGSGAARLRDRVGFLAAHDLAQSLGLLSIGAASAATLTVLLPQSLLDGVSSSVLLGITAAAVLAVLLAVCSEADAFIASSLPQFSPLAQLTFMVVGPAVDVKLVALQAGAFGWRFALRLSLLAFVCAVAAALATGTALL
jgi:uncharacterized membrane protein YraQ (UPF0718 family)